MMTVLGIVAAFACGVAITLLLRRIPTLPKTVVMVDAREFLDRVAIERPASIAVNALGVSGGEARHRLRFRSISARNEFCETEFVRRTDSAASRRTTRLMDDLVSRTRWCDRCADHEDDPHGWVENPAFVLDRAEASLPRLVRNR